MRKAVIENGAVANIIECSDDWIVPSGMTVVDPDPNTGPGDLYDGKTFSKPPTPKAPPKTTFDGAEFFARLTDAEYGAILAAAAQNVQLARWLDIFRLRGEIDLTGSTAQAAKAGLVAAKLLTQARADVIFATE